VTERRRPDVTDEETGARAFAVRKRQAAERGMQRIRAGLGPQWAGFTSEQAAALETLIGELWASTPREQWDRLHFGKLPAEDVRTLLRLALELRGHRQPAQQVLDEARALVEGKG
jgi:hypothetical protein